MNESVYSNHRSLTQPKFILPSELNFDTPQTMDGLVFLKQLPDASVPLVFFDPQYRSVLNKLQYGNEGERQKDRALLPQMEDQKIIEFITEIERVLIPSGHLMLWVDKLILVASDWQQFGKLQTVDMIVWNKGKIGMGYRTRRCSEYLVILQKNPIRAKGVWSLHDIPDVWNEKVDKTTHTHAKPISLLDKLIRAVTNEWDVVVDPAAGGYNVMKASMQTYRRFLGCDIVPLTALYP